LNILSKAQNYKVAGLIKDFIRFHLENILFANFGRPFLGVSLDVFLGDDHDSE